MYRHLSVQDERFEYEHIEKIKEAFPNLIIRDKHFYSDGFANDVLMINDNVVFRFPKFQWALDDMMQESECLKLTQLYTSMRIPSWTIHDQEFISYQKIPGEAMHRWHLEKCDQQVISQAAADLGAFLHDMHHIPMQACRKASIQDSVSRHDYSDWLKLYDDIQNELYPSMHSSVQDFTDTLFRTIIADNSMMDYSPHLIMGELSSSHIIFDSGKHAITGVVDFRSAGMGDPAFDIAYILYHYGERFTEILQSTYNGSMKLLQRARFIAETFPLQWALGGQRTGNPYWHLMHMGNSLGFRSAFIKH